jgi:hypothetical protein
MSSVPETEYRNRGAQLPEMRAEKRGDTRGEERGDKRGCKLGDKQEGREKVSPGKAETKTEKGTGTGTGAARRPLSPYTVHNLDTAITHLEIAMGADKAMAIFGSSYWHERVRELRSTPGILDVQERRLQCLLGRFAVTG